MRTSGKYRTFIFTLFILCSINWGCSLFPQPAQQVEFKVEPPPPVPTPEICSDNPPDLLMQVLFDNRDEQWQPITLNGIGFIPGEKVTIRITGQGIEHGVTIESQNNPIKADGSFSSKDALPLDDPSMDWEVHVVHQRGVACLGFHTER